MADYKGKSPFNTMNQPNSYKDKQKINQAKTRNESMNPIGRQQYWFEEADILASNDDTFEVGGSTFVAPEESGEDNQKSHEKDPNKT